MVDQVSALADGLAFNPKQICLSENSWCSGDFPLQLRILNTKQQMQEASVVRYKAYASKGLISEDESREYWDHYDALPTTIGLGAYDGNRLVGSMRLCFSQKHDPVETLPCGPHYPELIKIKNEQPRGVVEISRLAMDPNIKNTSFRATLYGFMVRAAYAAAQAANVSLILVVTKPEWVKFYRYMLGFEQIGSPTCFPPGIHPKTLMAGSLENARKREKKKNSFFRTEPHEVSSMRDFILPSLQISSQQS